MKPSKGEKPPNVSKATSQACRSDSSRVAVASAINFFFKAASVTTVLTSEPPCGAPAPEHSPFAAHVGSGLGSALQERRIVAIAIEKRAIVKCLETVAMSRNQKR